jgi:GxxExxY protein
MAPITKPTNYTNNTNYKESKSLTEIICKEESYQIIGACFEVYNEKGNGFTEPIYQECLEIELAMQQIPYQPKPNLPLTYKGRPLRQRFQPDVICYGTVILEIKAVSAFTDEHRSQVLNYLNATGYRLGLLVNFGAHGKLEWERIVR